jgi:hypothetical protein
MPELNIHAAQRLETPDGGEAGIDVDMVPLVRTLWAMGLRTAGCCQDLGESVAARPSWADEVIGPSRHANYWKGQAWLKMPLDDALILLSKVNDHAGFRERLTRSTHPDPWESYAYLLPGYDGSGCRPARHRLRRQMPAAIST